MAATAVLLSAAAATAIETRAQSVEESGGANDAAVRSLWSTLDAAWNERDARRFSDLFTVDATFVFVDRRQALEGRATIRELFEERFPQFADDLRHLTTVGRIHTVAPDVLTVDGGVEILRLGPGEGTEPATVRTFAIFAVMLRTPEGWRIRALRVYQLLAATADAE
ncbi:MAG: SgcJ/EcaC family oxidoreductase [Thermoanaerobaculia bacterium]